MLNQLPRGFFGLAAVTIILNILLFLGAVAVVAYAVKWVIS